MSPDSGAEESKRPAEQSSRTRETEKGVRGGTYEKGWQTDKELIWHRVGERKTVGINQSFHPVEALRFFLPNDRARALVLFFFLFFLFSYFLV